MDMMCVYCTVVQRCELCPQREGALKRTDNGSELPHELISLQSALCANVFC